MKKLLKYIDHNVLSKDGNLNNASILVRIFAGVLTSKAIAIYIGVEGMALIGNLKNFFSAVQSIAVLGFYSGLVKYIGEFKNDALKLSRTISTAYYFGFIATILVSFICYFNAQGVNDLLFSSNYNYTYVIKILAFALPFYALNLFSFAIINGFSKYRILMVINIIGQALGLLVTLVLIYQNKIDGALVAMVIAPSLMFLITLVGIFNRKSMISQINISKIDFDILKKLSPFAVMAFISGVLLPLVYILIRNYIIDTIGIKDAGHWEAMQRISDYYLLFVTSMMSMYIIPKFGGINNKKKFIVELKATYKSVIPVLALGMLAIYLLRAIVVKVVLNEAFQPVEELFLWQLLGDFVKVLSIVIAFQFIAKKMFAHFMVIELFLIAMIYFSSIYLVDIYGVKGAVMAHFYSYLLYFGIVLLIFKSSIFGIVSELEDME